MEKNILYLPQKDIDTKIIFHELGHCILEYKHYLDSEHENEIMYFTTSDKQLLNKETLDRFFQNPPEATIVAQNTELSLKLILNPFFLISLIIMLYSLFGNFKNLYKKLKEFG